MDKTFHILYFIISMILYAMMIFLWGSNRVLAGQIELTDYELLFASFFALNYIYLGVIDFLSRRSVYYELIKNSLQVIVNFSIVMITLLILNGIITGKTVVQMGELGHLELFLIGFFYTIVSVGTNYYFLKRELK